MRGQYVAFFDQISIRDIAQFGGKNASLGSMVRDLKPRGIRVPFGFAVSAAGYRYHLRHNNLIPAMQKVLDHFKGAGELDLAQLGTASAELRELVISKPLPGDLADEIINAYVELSRRYSADGWCDVAVRSSATAEDLPGASFAGQQETFLHIHSSEDLLQSYLLCCASLFTDRAMAYRREKRWTIWASPCPLASKKWSAQIRPVQALFLPSTPKQAFPTS